MHELLLRSSQNRHLATNHASSLLRSMPISGTGTGHWADDWAVLWWPLSETPYIFIPASRHLPKQRDGKVHIPHICMNDSH